MSNALTLFSIENQGSGFLDKEHLMKSWKINDREVQIFLTPDRQFEGAVIDSQGTHQVKEITDHFQTIVGIPASLSTNREKAARFFEQTHVRIIPFGNSYKLNFNVSGVGGNVKDVLKKTDKEIEEILIARLPNDSYELVHVTTGTHKFAGAGSMTTRTISLHVGYARYGWSFFGALFSGLFSINDEDFYKQNIHKQNLQDEIIKTLTGVKDKDGEDADASQIMAAYKQCTSIQLYISHDGNHIEIAFQSSRIIGGVYTVSHVTQKAFTLVAQGAFLIMIAMGMGGGMGGGTKT